MGTLILILIAVGIGWAIRSGWRTAKLHQAENETFMARHKGWDIYVSSVERGVLAINHDSARIVLGQVSAYKEYSWSAIASVEVLRDGGTLTQTNRGSQLGGAAVGGLLLGGAGALIGGLSGSKRSKAMINEMGIKVIVDDRTQPVHTIFFFRFPGQGIDAKSARLKPFITKLDHFHALLVNAVRTNQLATSGASQPPRLETTDQLTKLWELKQAGALTDDEFAEQKRTLLNAKLGPVISTS